MIIYYSYRSGLGFKLGLGLRLGFLGSMTKCPHTQNESQVFSFFHIIIIDLFIMIIPFILSLPPRLYQMYTEFDINFKES